MQKLSPENSVPLKSYPKKQIISLSYDVNGHVYFKSKSFNFVVSQSPIQYPYKSV